MLRSVIKKRGVTLIELVVATAIFAVVTTMAVGAFVTVSRMQTLTNNMKNTQQKLRVAIEMVSRLARQAQVVLVVNNNDVISGDTITSTVDMYFGLDENTKVPQSASRFEIKDYDGSGLSLYYSECRIIKADTKKCSNVTGEGWQTPNDLLSGPLRLDGTSRFIKIGAIPPTLTVTLHDVPAVGASNDPYYTDNMNIVNEIVLEQIR